MNRSSLYLLVALAFVFAATSASAQADLSSAQGLGISGRVTADDALAIAAHHTGGAVVEIEDDPEDAGRTFDVIVQMASGKYEVEVRQSDGAVLEVEPADGDEEDGEDDDRDEQEDDRMERSATEE